MKKLLASLCASLLMFSSSTVLAADMASKPNALSSNSVPVTFIYQDSSQELNKADKAPVKKNISRTDIESLKLGMLRAEVEKLLGPAHDYSGSGILRHVYYLNDGTSVELTYAKENWMSEQILYSITIIGKDGKVEKRLNQDYGIPSEQPKTLLSRQDFAFLYKGMTYSEVYEHVGLGNYKIGDIISYALKDGTNIELVFSENGLDYVQISDRNGNILQKLCWDPISNKILIDSYEQSKASLNKQDFAFLYKGMAYSEICKHVGTGKYEAYGDIISYALEDGTNIELIFSENGLDYVQITDRNGHIIQRPDWDSNSQKILLDSDALTKSETLNVPVLLNCMNIMINGEKVDMDNLVYNNTTYVALGKVAELFDKEMIWDSKTNTINIIDKNIMVDGFYTECDHVKPALIANVKGNTLGLEFQLKNITSEDIILTLHYPYFDFMIYDENDSEIFRYSIEYGDSATVIQDEKISSGKAFTTSCKIDLNQKAFIQDKTYRIVFFATFEMKSEKKKYKLCDEAYFKVYKE